MTHKERALKFASRVRSHSDIADLEQAFREVEKEAYELAAKVIENGRFLHDDAPDAKFGKAAAIAIRRLIQKQEG